MASSSAAAAIKARLKAGWTATKIYAPNEIADLPDVPVPLVVLEFPGGVGDQITVGVPGANLFRETEVFMLHVLVPTLRGDETARAYAAQLAALFRDRQFDGVNCLAPFPPSDGSDRAKGNYWGVSFAVPYYFDLLA